MITAEGYTRLGNKVFEFLYNNDLNASELKIMLFLIRYTKGFNRSTTRAGYDYIANGTGLSYSTTRRTVKSLIEKGFIKIEYPASGSAAQVVRIEWSKLSTSGVHPRAPQVVNNDHDKVSTSDHQDNKEDITDIYNKDNTGKPPYFEFKKRMTIEELGRLCQEEGDE